ncbi:hypothetical protein [Selenomonas sp. AB3002]|uniref:hypothetical protein n=1 Tax=Selenomonas sp. AB3002 TaxID=1392502 RepID=UPI0004957C08
MIAIPKSYAEWINLLAMIKEKKEDNEVLEAMHQGELIWQPGIAERFMKKFIEVINFRMNAATDRFQLEMKRSGNSDSMIVQSILHLRKEMQFLLKLSDLNVLPEVQRNTLRDMIDEQIVSMQKSLEDSAKSDRTGKMLSIVRKNRLDSIIRERRK